MTTIALGIGIPCLIALHGLHVRNTFRQFTLTLLPYLNNANPTLNPNRDHGKQFPNPSLTTTTITTQTEQHNTYNNSPNYLTSIPHKPNILPVPRPNRLLARRPHCRRRHHRLRAHRQHPLRDSRLHGRRPVRPRRLQDLQQAALRRRAGPSGQRRAGWQQHPARHQVAEIAADRPECAGEFRLVDLCQCHGEGKEQVFVDALVGGSGWAYDGLFLFSFLTVRRLWPVIVVGELYGIGGLLTYVGNKRLLVTVLACLLTQSEKPWISCYIQLCCSAVRALT